MNSFAYLSFSSFAARRMSGAYSTKPSWASTLSRPCL
jgi:hypothetical protein